KGGKKKWLTLLAQEDFSILSSERDVCLRDNPNAGWYYCAAEDGGKYIGTPDTSSGDAINGGFAPATTRLAVGLDFLLGKNFTLGARAGYAFFEATEHSATTSLHLEGRLAYWIGKDPFERKVVRPFVAIVGGMAEIDTKVSVQILETEKEDLSNGIITP